MPRYVPDSLKMNLQVFETVFAFTIVVLLCLLLRKLSIIKTGENLVLKILSMAMRQKIFLAITIVTSLAVTSCKEKKFNKAGKTTNQTEATKQSAVKQIVEDEMVTATVTDTSGARLDMTFNNTKGTAAFKLNGETIEMKQDTMGSGIKYSNEKYEFTEWHGRIELKKEGKTIFIKSNDN